MGKRLPTSIYRLQLHEGFNFKAARAVLPYLKKLGVEAVYCSPYLKAYSQHGYDITNPNELNPKLGTEEEFSAFCVELKRLKLQHFIDIVPNHMGNRGGNPWWQDVLERGQKSPYAKFFDIDWEAMGGKLLLPVLGRPYGECLDGWEINLEYSKGRFFFRYFEECFPLARETWPKVSALDAINENKAKLHALLERQHYRLASWKVAGKEINYRRFFNFNDLAAMRIEDPEVLREHHRFVFELAKRRVIDGIRIDHPDGLYDPKSYFDAVKKKTKLPLFLEKILDPHEKLPEEWPVEGTVGYDYLNKLTALYIDKRAEKKISGSYERFVGKHVDFGDLLYEKKKFFAKTYMQSEIEQLGALLNRVSELDYHTRDLTRSDLTDALLEVIASFPVYRTYIGPKTDKVSKRDKLYIQEGVQRARERNPKMDPQLFSFIESLLLLERKGKEERHCVLRIQQFTGPIMARGLEDICFYIYNRFLSLNEVGGDPRHFGISPGEFHEYNEEKHHRWPHTVLATSTHDTKRSEDVRMRLNVLSELADEWDKLVFEWSKLHRAYKRNGAPSPNTEYYIYQMLIGLWSDEILTRSGKARLWNNLLKSIKEAREETNWITPNLPYENHVKHFLFAVLDRKNNPRFFKAFIPFANKVAKLGYLNSLSSLVVKMGSPGIVDIYQGNESWNFSWVDPDNRRDLDFFKLEKDLDKMELKNFVTSASLSLRTEHPALFLEGDYIPLKASDERVIAFARKKEKKIALILALRFFSRENTYEEASVTLPFAGAFKDIFSQKEHLLKKGKNRLELLFKEYPFAILIN